MKICATTLGETGGDLISMTLNVGYLISSLILISIFLVTVISQVASRRFHPALYWSVILSTSMAGTTMSDYMDRSLGLGYTTGSAILLSLLIAVLVIWKLTTGSLNVSVIRSLRVELFYWTAILISNTLGTASGDFLADDSGLGFGGSAALIAAAIAVIVLLHYLTPIPGPVLFWIAFVLTRPLGATVGDLFTKSHAQGGLGFGTIGASAVLAGALVVLVLINGRRANRVEPAAATPAV